MKKIPSHIRKVLVLITGIPILIIGIILIPLPGPGLLVCFAGLFILAQEFEWAAKHADRLKGELKKITDKAKQKQTKPSSPPKKPSKKS